MCIPFARFCKDDVVAAKGKDFTHVRIASSPSFEYIFESLNDFGKTKFSNWRAPTVYN